MTETEEKAVEYLKANSLVRLNENNEVVAYGNAHKYYIINLIKKLQKEIEDSIPKDKIREIIEELEKQEDWYIENKSLDDLYGKIDILKELLEEEQ